MRLRHKIEKASAAKQRKARKDAKKNPQWRSRLKKDPGIPNLFPYKDQILEEIEEKKRRKAEAAQELRDAAKANRAAAKQKDGDMEVDDDDDDDDDEEGDDDEDSVEMEDADADGGINPMAALLASAQARASDFSKDSDLHGDVSDDSDDEDRPFPTQDTPSVAADIRNPDSSRKAFDKIFQQVLEQSDVILYVLDARDPDGTRSQEVERQIMASDNGAKRLILVLNKIDLVPLDVLNGWMKHLKRYFPVLPLRASTPASNAQTFDHKQYTIKNTSEALLRSLKAYAASKQMKRSISVGVIGYPNVGKSSVINALTSRLNGGKQSFACPVGSEAGVTTALRKVKIDSKLHILDSPGIVFPTQVDKDTDSRSKRKAEHEARLILLNALPPKQIDDPIPAVSMLLQRLSQSQALYEKLLQHYGIVALGPFGQGDITTDFLVQVARKRGRLGKGGVPNLNAAAMTVITDWRDGRIQGWVEPPTLRVTEDAPMAGDESRGSSADQKMIVKEWAEEFKLDGLWDGNE